MPPLDEEICKMPAVKTVAVNVTPEVLVDTLLVLDEDPTVKTYRIISFNNSLGILFEVGL